MKSIRWGGLITFVILFIIVIVAALFTGTVLKPVLESAFTEMNGAKDKINIAYSPFTLEIDNIQITDPSEPMINTAQIEQLRLVLSFGRMLMGQLVIDDASIVSDHVRFEATAESLLMKGDGIMGSVSVEMGRESESVLSLEISETSKAMFSLNYLSDIVKAASAVSEVATIEFSTDMPIRLDFEMQQEGKLQYYLAPRIDD